MKKTIKIDSVQAELLDEFASKIIGDNKTKLNFL